MGDNTDIARRKAVRTVVWDHLRRLAKSRATRRGPSRFSVVRSPQGLRSGVMEEIGRRPPAEQLPNADVDRIVREVYFDAVAKSLVVPGLGEWGIGDWTPDGSSEFSDSGLDVLGGDEFNICADGSVADALVEAKGTSGLQVEEHEIQLLAEAQRCWQAGCFRAAAVLIGLANESRCLSLVDAVVANLPAPSSGDLMQDFSSAKDATKQFTARWRPTLRLLERCRGKLRSAGMGQPWWQAWEGVPGVLETLGEAVRLSRNTAAHDPHREFGRADVALLLAAMPHQIRVVGDLSDFFRKVQPAVTLPAL